MYYEWSRHLSHSGVFITEEKLGKIVANAPDPGYSSLYGFLEKPSSAIGLNKKSVYAEEITLDLDGGDDELAIAEEILQEYGYGYRVYSSGGKGYHVMIPHYPASGLHLPYSHLRWVQDHKLPHDVTLYQHGRLLSLPGRIHPKTKQRKRLVKEVLGEMAFVHIQEPEIVVAEPKFSDADDLKTAVVRLCSLVVNGPSQGDRHMTLWKMARDMMKAGWDFDTSLDILLTINDTWENPKTEKEVRKAVRGAYK